MAVPDQLSCGNCGHKWMPRGKEYSLRCPAGGASLPEQSGRNLSSFVLIALIFVIAPVGVYFAWPHFFPPQPLPQPPGPAQPPSVEVIPPEIPRQPAPAADPKPVEKPDPKPEPPTPPAPKPSPEELAAADNKAAARKLNLVKPFLDRGDTATARKRLKEIIDPHPDTPSADEARKLLEKLPASAVQNR